MKKILIYSASLCAAIIIFLISNPQAKPVKDRGAALVPAGGDSCLPVVSKDYTKPELNGEIDARLAVSMSRNYANDLFKGYLSGGGKTKKKDALCIWFEIGKLKHLISVIENSICEKDCGHHLNPGIRFYYAMYPLTTGTNAAPPDLRYLPRNYAGRHTIFMVGTYDNAIGKHIDFDPLDVGENKCAPTSYKALLLKGGTHKTIGLNGLRNLIYLNGDTTVNHGDLMPPPDGYGIFPTGENNR